MFNQILIRFLQNLRLLNQFSSVYTNKLVYPIIIKQHDLKFESFDIKMSLLFKQKMFN